jgi:Complex I intermediate-associated protein 30 (CIA30)
MKTMSDSSVGGYSTANLSQVPATDFEPSHILFHGNISTKLPENRPEVQRTGYAAFRNQDRGRSLFGRLFWDVDAYMYLALRLKSDGRKYFVNIQTVLSKQTYTSIGYTRNITKVPKARMIQARGRQSSSNFMNSSAQIMAW